MKILAIETSCDETAVAVLSADSTSNSTAFTVLGNALLSQVDLHTQYGGVFPALAKREHAKNLVAVLEATLEEAELERETTQAISKETETKIREILAREHELADAFFAYVGEIERPNIDAIAVTYGPGLEPALWVGINFAKALSLVWNIPIVGVNHMEGHMLAALAENTNDELRIANIELPVLALLISGGHTELVLMKEWLSYELLGQTRDDAVGEAFDKVARMLDLPYPGGPEISKLAESARLHEQPISVTLPRPMIDSDDLDFSFSGLKTAVLYFLKRRGSLTEDEKRVLAKEFEDAVGEVLWKKTAKAIKRSGAKTVVMGGGVSANMHIQRIFLQNMKDEFPEVTLRIPAHELTTDNAVMIGIAGYFRAREGQYETDLEANGTLSLA